MVVLHIILTMFLWSMVKAVISEPGAVPEGWGYIPEGDKKRRYCLLCHGFQPER
jgi:hypothetical protein